METTELPRRWLRSTVCVALLATMALPVWTAPPVLAGAGDGNAVTRWVDHALAAVRTGQPAIHTSTPGAGRTYAMVTAAMYDAVNGIDVARGTSTRPPRIVPPDGAPAEADREAAAVSAAHEVLSVVFGVNDAVQQRIGRARSDELAAAGGDGLVMAGEAWGRQVGRAVLEARQDDGSQVQTSKPGGTGAGVFPRAFTGTQFRTMTPFGIESPEPHRTPGPPRLDSVSYARDLEEVRTIGSSTDDDPERTAIARHWLAEGGTVRETGLWLKAALGIAVDQGTTASLSETARLFSLLGTAIADSVIVSWQDKYDVHFWRPGDAIRQADIDGNDRTSVDPTWSPRNGVCTAAAVSQCGVFGGSPEHTSGTSTFAGAASTVLTRFYGRDDVAFSVAGEQAAAPVRSYASFTEAAREAGRSRIYGGIHFQFSNEAGYRAGRSIAKEILKTSAGS